jgi:NIPSNAP protein
MSLTRRDFVAVAASAAIAKGADSGRAPTTPPEVEPGVLELRQYTLHRSQRDTLIALFEKEFLEPQNALGAHVMGTFRDVDDPDRFVWLRGFRDMAMRQRSLEAFYGGPVWHSKREAANATMLDSDNVLLLRPTLGGQGFQGQTGGKHAESIIGACIYYLDNTDPDSFSKFFDRAIVPRFAAMNVHPLARYITHDGPNNFRLPIRQHDRVYIWFARWSSVREEEDFFRSWSAVTGWRDDAPEGLLPAFMRKPERLRLSPTARSELS